LSRGLFDQYINEQRRTIIEERKLEREIQLQLEKEQLMLEEQQQNELKTHIDLLQEEIKKLEQDEKILQREQDQVCRDFIVGNSIVGKGNPKYLKDSSKTHTGSFGNRLE
jgi:hypothetical protein